MNIVIEFVKVNINPICYMTLSFLFGIFIGYIIFKGEKK